MSPSQVNLLSPEDLKTIETLGSVSHYRPDLAVDSGNGGVVLTVKGIQFYKAACLRYGVTLDLTSVNGPLMRGALDETLMRRAREEADENLMKLLQAGKVPAQYRESVEAHLSGHSEAWCVASQRQRRFASAGPNVIGVQFKK